MVNVKIHFGNNVPPSSRCGATHAKGCAFLNDEIYSSTKLSELFATSNGPDDVLTHLQRLNGFFAIASPAGDYLCLAVDHVRSLPLFYGIRDMQIFVSDDARWVLQHVRDKEIDRKSVIEFLLTRCVWGRDTLFRQVRQVPAGGMMTLSATSEGLHEEFRRYYEFGYTKPCCESFQQLASSADAALLAAFQRLVKVAAGKTIVVPLGGGLDSRLILLMLKRMDYDKVVAFTYGRRGYREALISRKVAEKIGFRWEFVEYTNEAWRRWYDSPEWISYSDFSDGLCSTPHLQDWPAVWELKMRAAIPDDSIIVPGHMPAPPDSVRKLPLHWLKVRSISDRELAEEICDGYCTLQDWSLHRETFRPELCEKIRRVLQLPPQVPSELAIGYFDRWWWETSWSKFMINSVRAYEFWGYGWWLPLWDLEFVRIWRALPLDLRLGKRFELPYVQRFEIDTTGGSPIRNTSTPTLGPALVGTLETLRLRNPVRRIRARLEYDRHHFAWYGLIPKRDYMRSFHGKENINTYLANQTFRRIFPNYEIPEGLDFLAQGTETRTTEK